MSDRWIEVGDQRKFSEGLHVMNLGKRRIVIARLQGQLFAFDALCPHVQGPMECSEIDGLIVSCPLHAWRFDLSKGGKELHGYRDLETIEIMVVEERVFLPADAARA